jgi:hypothetical protein
LFETGLSEAASKALLQAFVSRYTGATASSTGKAAQILGFSA